MIDSGCVRPVCMKRARHDFVARLQASGGGYVRYAVLTYCFGCGKAVPPEILKRSDLGSISTRLPCVAILFVTCVKIQGCIFLYAMSLNVFYTSCPASYSTYHHVVCSCLVEALSSNRFSPCIERFSLFVSVQGCTISLVYV